MGYLYFLLVSHFKSKHILNIKNAMTVKGKLIIENVVFLFTTASTDTVTLSFVRTWEVESNYQTVRE